MAMATLIAFILALNLILVSSFKLNSKPIDRNVRSPTEATADPCQPNPCLYGGRCVPIADQKDYRCTECPYPMGGDNCEDLTCAPDCFKVGNKVFFIYPNKDTEFSTSYTKCQEEGLKMAMLKDASVHDPVRGYLAALNVDHYNDSYCYWIGLRRGFTGDPWRWTDGTELGDYQAWFVPPYNLDNCGNICNGKWAYKFASDRCYGNEKWKYFSLCETSLPLNFAIDVRTKDQ